MRPPERRHIRAVCIIVWTKSPLRSKIPSLVAAVAAAAALIGGVAASQAVGVDGLSGLLSLTPESVHRFAEAWGRWAALGSITLMVVHSVLPLPAEVIAVANGMMFGPVWGVAVTWAGAMLGAAISFAFARWLGRPALRRVASEFHRQWIERWRERPLFLLFVRLIPVISFNLINYAAGATGVGWWRFLWTTGLGILPITVASVVLGDRLLAASWQTWAAVAAGLVLIGLALRWLRRKIVAKASDDWVRRDGFAPDASPARRNDAG